MRIKFWPKSERRSQVQKEMHKTVGISIKVQTTTFFVLAGISKNLFQLFRVDFFAFLKAHEKEIMKRRAKTTCKRGLE